MSRIESPAVSQLAFNRLRERRSIRFHLRLSMGATPNAGNCNRSDRWLRTRVRCSPVDFPPTASSGETATARLIAPHDPQNICYGGRDNLHLGGAVPSGADF